MVARHPRRPYTLDYLSTIFTDFIELHGDRLYRDDPAIVGGWARLAGVSVMVIGHQKGRDTKENLKRNFGMAHPEGYRKALRLMQAGGQVRRPGHHADRHARRLPRPRRRGARPVRGAGAQHPRDGEPCPTPTVAVVIGEGGSGGALALGVADRVLMLENSVYSVISPEGCAAILWKDACPAGARRRGPQAHRRRTCSGSSSSTRSSRSRWAAPTSIPTPTGEALREALIRHVTELRKIRPEKLVRRRAEKYGGDGRLHREALMRRRRVEVRFKGTPGNRRLLHAGA